MKTLKEIHKEYKLAKMEHCDNCDDEECQTCKPEFDKLRKEERDILDNLKCKNCERNGFRNIDRRSNKIICITCGDALHEDQLNVKEVSDGNK